MANVIHLRCRHCGELMQDREQEYCPPCNLYLAYRAMPFLLGMLLIGQPAAALANRCVPALPAGGRGSCAGDGEDVLDLAAHNWE